MKSVEFESYIKSLRELKNIPQRTIANALNLDTNTLSSIELGERQVIIEMIKGLSEILEIDFEELQIKFISDKILSEYAGQPFLKEAISTTLKKLN